MRRLVLACVVLFPANAYCADLAKPALIYGGAALADYASTVHALNAGARESNPFLRNGRLEAGKAAQVAALVGIDVLLQRKGMHGKAKALRIGAAVIGGALAVHNMRVAQRQKELK